MRLHYCANLVTKIIKNDCLKIAMKMCSKLSLVFLFVGLFFTGEVMSQKTDPKIELADSIYYSDPDRSCKLCNEALVKAKGNADYDIIADAQMCLARYYLLKTNYSFCERNIKASIIHFEKLNNKSRLASAFNLYAILYDRLGEKQKSYDYQNEAIRLFKEIENIQGMSNIMNNLANAYISDNRLSQAKEILDEIETYKDRISQGSLYFFYQNYGYLMLNSQKYKDALSYFEKALKIAQERKMRDSEITAFTFIAKTHIKLKRFDEANRILLKAETLAEAGNLEYEIQEIYEVQKELFTIQKNAGELERVNNKIEAFEKRKLEEEEQKTKVEIEQRKQELKDKLDQQRKALRDKKAELEERRKPDVTIIVIIGFAVLLFTGFLFYRSKKRS
jgi:tetratricopeptide (TPR) repeat protein